MQVLEDQMGLLGLQDLRVSRARGDPLEDQDHWVQLDRMDSLDPVELQDLQVLKDN